MSGLPMVGDEFAGYRLRAVLGRGGMSVVYQAENPRLGSVIALKVLAPELAADDVFRARFLEESRIAASLNHPNVIPIYDMGSSDELLYIAMRYVSGTDLRQMIKKRGRILPDTAIFLLGQAARALDAAHRKGLVHRDVKPGNLLIERGSDDGDPDHVYLADFGITKHAMSRSGLTSTGQFLGTIDYVAPEQIRGTSVLGLADQYSLGCVLYECLTGRVPFEKDLDAAIIWAHVEEPPTMPTVIRPELPREIDDVFARVLAKRPGDRYESCREFMEAARLALGLPTLGPQTAASPGFVAGTQPGSTPDSPTALRSDGFSWDRFASQSRPADPAASGAPGSWSGDPAPGTPPGSWSGDPAASGGRGSWPGDPARGDSGGSWSGGSAGAAVGLASPPPTESVPVGGRTGSGNTLTSHRREAGATGPGAPGGSPPSSGQPPRRRAFLTPRWIAVLAALVLVAAGLGTWALVSGGSHGKTNAMGGMSMSPKPKPKPTTSALMKALTVTNQSMEATGKLPPSTCKQQGNTMVTCESPYVGVNEVVFQTYPSLKALYNAYTAKVTALAGSGPFKQNFNDCGLEQTNGEVGWNHEFKHPKNYTVAMMSAGMVTNAQAAGRVYCTFSNSGLEYMVWTQNSGNMMGVVAGGPHEDVWNWWVDIHHNITLAGAPMNM